MSRVPAVGAALCGAALIVLLASCAPEDPLPAPTPTETFAVTGDGVLRVGTLLPLTGDLAPIGQSQVAGVELAVREINLAGGVDGVPVEVFHRNAGDATTVAASFAALTEKGVDVVIGPESAELVQLVAADAAAAGIPIISTSLVTPVEADDTATAAFFGLQPPFTAQGSELGRLLNEDGVERVALISLADDTADSDVFADSLAAALEEGGARLAVSTVVASGETDFARLRAVVDKSRADAIVVSTPAGATAEVVAIVTQLAEAGFSGDELWFTTANSVSYAEALPLGALEGARGLAAGAALPPAFLQALGQSDPVLPTAAFAAEAHDAVVLAALAAILGGDDGGPAIGRHLHAVASDGIPCGSFAECADVLTTQTDIDFRGASGPLDMSAEGSVSSGGYTALGYSAENVPTPIGG